MNYYIEEARRLEMSGQTIRELVAFAIQHPTDARLRLAHRMCGTALVMGSCGEARVHAPEGKTLKDVTDALLDYCGILWAERASLREAQPRVEETS
jgi:hypothetical protein